MDTRITTYLAKLDGHVRLFFFVVLLILARLGLQDGIPFREFREGVHSDLRVHFPSCLTDAFNMADCDEMFFEAFDFLGLDRSADLFYPE
jgi:hypothetical protein